MPYQPAPEFQDLYDVFTADPESIGAHLNGHLGRLSDDAPLLVATGNDIVIFPGDGKAPITESFRRSTRGFVELTAVSHLGVAVPYLARLRELDYAGWRDDAGRLLASMAAVKQVNTQSYWRDTVAVRAWQGLEEKIVALVDYSCYVTTSFLGRALTQPAHFDMARVRDMFLDPKASPDVPVPMNDMMAATFALVYLDTAHRIMGWLDAQELDWSRLMVVLSGQVGRPTAGLTWRTNSLCHLLWRASGEALLPERLLIAPSAPALSVTDLEGEGRAAALEARFRQIWYSTQVTVEMGRLMYEGYPAFRSRAEIDPPVIDAKTETASALPTVTSAEDRRAIITRLRFVMEDPGQQLVNASSQFIVDQLVENGNRPETVIVPGFTNTAYPCLTPSAAA